MKSEDLTDPNFRLYGMTLAQIRRLKNFYIERTGDRKLERLARESFWPPRNEPEEWEVMKP